MNTSYIFLAEGFEEVEALTVVDVLRRAGVDIKTVSITPLRNVRGSHGIEVNVDCLFDETDFSDADWLICPGGLPGSTNLAAYAPLCELLKKHRHGIAAICAHTNLDAAEGGVNSELARRMGLEDPVPLEVDGEDENGVPYGIGRVGTLPRPCPWATLRPTPRRPWTWRGSVFWMPVFPCPR